MSLPQTLAHLPSMRIKEGGETSYQGERSMSEWRSIETAPKDGTLFIIGRDNSVHPVNSYSGAAYWNGKFFQDPKAVVTATRWIDPTHLMPLPSPPAITKGEGA